MTRAQKRRIKVPKIQPASANASGSANKPTPIRTLTLEVKAGSVSS